MIVVSRAILKWMKARRRRTDMEILWPICLREAGDLDKAKAAFFLHAVHDPAWQELGEDGIYEFINLLKE
jgi:hypothetical protein